MTILFITKNGSKDTVQYLDDNYYLVNF